jgi:predicted phosphate transport protein (TIGR00153 family)
MQNLEKRSYAWFERRRRTKALDLAQEQITKALDTVTLLHQAIKNMSESKKKEALQSIENLFKTEKEVDSLRTEVFKELSKGAALFAEYREDLMHLVKRLDTLADHVKDASRCVKMLVDSQIPKELWDDTAHMASTLVDCAHALRGSIEKITVNPSEAIEGAKKVEEIEHEIDEEYLKIKTLFVRHSEKMNCGSMVIFDDLVEFIEHAADMCADTADYIVILSSRE